VGCSIRRPSDRLVQAFGQALGLVAIGAVGWWLARGFGFLKDPANFAVGDTLWLHVTPEDSIARAIAAGLLNTARVSFLGCLLALILGFVLGVLRVSRVPAVVALVRTGVDLVRGTPLLLVLLLLAALLHGLPPARAAFQPLPGVFLSDRGLMLPLPGDVPRFTGFNFTGGLTVSPEFAALLLALVLHQAAHISEVVRGAILAVPRGQIDAARALGLTRLQTVRWITLPHAVRAMVPLLAANCVSLIKNSSLAVAIGFPDVTSILNTTGNQTGHTLETMVIMITVYLTLSLVVAATLDRYNRRVLG
jgi:His/Glu/Gln/Arg/opine family amino acid ABC transporter permease subunit